MRAIRRLASLGALALATPAAAQNAPPWLMPDILPAAKAEGALVVYSSINESEGLPQWKLFEDATGIKVQFVRGADGPLNSRIAIEGRAGQKTWDVIVTSAVGQIPAQFLAPFEIPEAAGLIPQARARDKRWYGTSANYNTPAFNTRLVRKEDLPTSYEGFLARKEWKGRVAIDTGDQHWLSGMFQHYGEERARQLIKDIVATLDPVVHDGHLALARSVGAGEYVVALNNYMNLTFNVAMNGAPTDIFVLDPVTVHMVPVGVSANAPHPNAARLAANFAVSQQGQAFSAKFGRIPVRGDVTPTPADALQRLAGKTLVATTFGPEDDRKWKRVFDELVKRR